MPKEFVSRKQPVDFNSKFDLGNMVYRSPQSFEHLYFEESLCPDTGEKVINYHSDIFLMFHQERLDRQSADALFSKIQSQPKGDPLRELSNKLTKSQLCQFVKSRYCQSLSELRTYSEQINSMLESEFEEFKASLNRESEHSLNEQEVSSSSVSASGSASAAASSE